MTIRAPGTWRSPWRYLLAAALLWLLLFYFTPVGTIILRSVTEPLADGDTWWANYSWFFGKRINNIVLFRTVLNSLEVTALCLVFGYPYAYRMTTVGRLARAVMISVAVIPLWTSVVARNYAWLVLLQDKGAINYVLNAVGLPTFSVINTTTAVLVAECQIMMPFMILALYATMSGIDRTYLAAAQSLGAKPFRAFVSVYLPMSVPGIIAGCVLVFVQSLGFYLTPAMLGSTQNSLLPQLIVTQVDVILDWGKGGTAALVLLVAIVAILIVGSRASGRVGLVMERTK
jgi:putative spermidine/putrescine transport system permease protein